MKKTVLQQANAAVCTGDNEGFLAFCADEQGNPVPHAYCDVWRFHDGKMVELNAYVIPVRR